MPRKNRVAPASRSRQAHATRHQNETAAATYPPQLTAAQLIDLLNLEPLPGEGGYFRRTYESAEQVPLAGLPARYGKEMHFGTAIYYLLTPESFSALHRLDTDEVYHFYYGDPVEVLLLHPKANSQSSLGEIFVLGTDLLSGMRPQMVAPKGVWQGSLLLPSEYGFALLGTTMAPGFDPDGWELGDGDELRRQFPAFAQQIVERTYRNAAERAVAKPIAGLYEPNGPGHRSGERSGVGNRRTLRTGGRTDDRPLSP